MPFDASKVERKTGVLDDANACAAALDEVRAELVTLRSEAIENARIVGMSGSREAALLAEVEKLKGIVRKYRDSAKAHWPCGNGEERCFLCKRADEALEGR